MDETELMARPDFLADQRGIAAAEFAIVLPLLALLSIGSIFLSFMMYATTALHFATEDAARCAAIRVTVCSDQATTAAYATARYAGPTLAGLNFTLTPAAAGACGSQVQATGTYSLRTGLATLNVPVSAQACYAN